MPRPLTALAVALALAAPAAAEIKIRDVKARHGQHGPERTSLTVYPGDEVVFTFVTTGVQTDTDGKVDCETRMQIADEAGKTLVDNKTATRDVLTLGGAQLHGSANMTLGLATAPGDFHVTVTVTDNLRQESASFHRKVTCQKLAFAVVRPRISFDKAGTLPAGTTFALGQQVHFKLTAVGFDRSEKKVHVGLDMQMIDERGKETMPKPISTVGHITDEAEVGKTDSLTFTVFFVCNRPGTFKAKFTVTDKATNKVTTFEVPIKVLE